MNVTITAIINGQERQIKASASVLSLLDELGIEPRKIAIEHNLEIVPKSAYETTLLMDGDRIEIVQFVGGG